MVEVFLRHAYAVVVEVEVVVFLVVMAQAHAAHGALGVGHGIADKVHEHPREQIEIALDVCARRHIVLEAHGSDCAGLHGIVGHSVRHIVVVDLLKVDERAALLQARYGRDVGHELHQAVAVFLHLIQEMPARGLVHVGIVHDGVDVALDYAYGRL